MANVKLDQLWRFLAIILPIVSVCIQAYFVRNLLVDDALIYTRYVKHFHDGIGLVYNEGVLFNGLSSPLFAATQILLGFLSENYIQNSFIICLLAMMGTSLVGAAVFSDDARNRLITGLAISSFSFFYLTFGMETPLFLFFISLSLYLFRIRSPYLSIAIALAFCTRGEGVFLGILPLAEIIRSKRLPPLTLLVLSAAIALLPLLCNYLYFGEILAQTGGAKSGQGRSGLWGSGILILQPGIVWDWAWGGSSFAPILVGTLAALGFTLLYKNAAAIGLMCFTLLLLGFYILLNIPGYHWYFGPLFFTLILYMSTAVAFAVGTLYAPIRSSNLTTVSLVFLAFAGLLLPSMVEFEEKGPQQSYVDIGTWLKDNAPPTASVGMVEIGTVGWFSDLEVVDILGLVVPHNAEYIGARQLHEWLRHYQPDYIFVHQPLWPQEVSAGSLEKFEYYSNVERFDFPGYRLLSKMPAFTAVVANQFADAAERPSRSVVEAALTADKPYPMVSYDQQKLFAHAPVQMWIDVASEDKSLELEYGVLDGAKELHSGICFSLSTNSETQYAVLWRDCIDKSSDVSTRSAKILLQGRDERLYLRTECVEICDYGWSYINRIEIHN